MTVDVSQLVMEFGGVTALSIDELELDGPGSIALVGPNGAGKSTLLLIVAGLLKPTSGTVRVGGEPAGSLPVRRALSFIPDQPALFDDLTLADQLLYVARLYDNTEPSPRCRDLIDALDAAELLAKFPRAMSKGQRQKASLLVGTARPFSHLLLDEPTTALDADSRTALVAALRAFGQDDVTVIFSTHDQELIAAADEQVALVQGELHHAWDLSSDGQEQDE